MVKQQDLRKLFCVSLFFHLIVLTTMIVSIEFSSRHYVLENSDKEEIINAMVVTPTKIQLSNPSPISSTKHPQPPQKNIIPQKAISHPVAKPEPKPLAKPQPVAKTDAIAISNHKKQIKKDLEKQLLADIKQTEKLKKKKHQELEKAFEQELKEQSAKSLQQQLKSEQERIASGKTAKMRGIVNKYTALILQAIEQHWLVPNGVEKSLSTQLLIRVAPGGAVLDVQLVKSSGDEALDRSARVAVFKASPLPVPDNSDEFEPFREFILKVKPENVLARDNGLS